MSVDLHLHSSYSDGSDSPSELVQGAVRAGLSAIALTDHDILDGIPEARTAADAAGIDLIPGVELSVGWPSGRMHLLGYWIEPGPGPLQDRLVGLRDGRAARNTEIIAALRDLGHDITEEEVAAEAGEGAVGRPHIAAVLVRKGAVATVSDAFDAWLANGRPAYRERPRLQVDEAAALIRESGGVSAVAHPHTVEDGAAGFEALFERLASIGVDGVECHYSEYEPELRTRLTASAEHAGLVATGGSDYHGTYKPSISIGIGKGDLSVPDAALTALATRRPATA